MTNDNWPPGNLKFLSTRTVLPYMNYFEEYLNLKNNCQILFEIILQILLRTVRHHQSTDHCWSGIWWMKKRKTEKSYCYHGQAPEAESLDSVKPNQLWFMIDTCWLQNWFFSNKIIQRGTNSRQTPDNQLSIIYHQGGTVFFLISFNKK